MLRAAPNGALDASRDRLPRARHATQHWLTVTRLRGTARLDALSVRLNCTAPTCAMILQLSQFAASSSTQQSSGRRRLSQPGGVLFDMRLTFPDNGPGDTSAAVAQATSAAAGLATTATQLQDAYKVEGTPSLGVAGRFYIDGTLAGSMPRALQVADALIAQTRQGR